MLKALRQLVAPSGKLFAAIYIWVLLTEAWTLTAILLPEPPQLIYDWSHWLAACICVYGLFGTCICTMQDQTCKTTLGLFMQ